MPSNHYPYIISRRTFMQGMVGFVGLAVTGCDLSGNGSPTSPSTRSKVVTYYDVSSASHLEQVAALPAQGYRLLSLSVYGHPTHPFYAAVWIQRGGPDWQPFNDLDAAQYQQAYNLWTAQGYRPTILSITGSRAAAVFAGVFEQDATPFIATYHLVSNGDIDLNNLNYTETDTATIQYWNQWADSNNYILRWAAVYGDAMHPLYAGIWEANTSNAAWNWDNGYFDSESTYQHRLQAIHQLIEKGVLNLHTNMQQVLQLKTPSGGVPTDPRFEKVEIWHLLSHLGGWNIFLSFDPLLYDAHIAKALNISLPVNKYQIASFMAGQPLQFDPGSQIFYSPFGYSLLGQIIEKVTGMSYTQFVKQSILAPLGLQRPHPGRSLYQYRAPGEVRYHGQSPYVEPSVLTPGQPLVPYAYGGINIENRDATGSKLMAPADLVKILAAFDRGQEVAHTCSVAPTTSPSRSFAIRTPFKRLPI